MVNPLPQPVDQWAVAPGSQFGFDPRIGAQCGTIKLGGVRFELERQLVEGTLPVADLPAAWNEKFEKIFGLRVPNDSLGCLQDIHWSLGSFGYFPTYHRFDDLHRNLRVSIEHSSPLTNIGRDFRI